ncbi:hypothetical protein [Azospirillum sp. sgz301742]
MFALFLTFLAWYACGIAGFLYWWSEDCEVDGMALIDSLAFGIMGPLNVLTGYLVHRLMSDKGKAEAEADWRDVTGTRPHR